MSLRCGSVLGPIRAALAGAFVAVALVPATGGAGERSLALSVDSDTVDTTAANPRRGLAAFGGQLQLPVTESLAASFGLTYARDRHAAPAAGVAFAGTSSAVTALQAGVNWQHGDHLSLALGGSFAPRATSTYGVPLSDAKTGSTTVTSALVSSATATGGAQATLSLDSAGEGALDHQLDITTGYTRTDTRQQLLELADAAGTASAPAALTCTPPGKSHNTKQCDRISTLQETTPASTAGVPQEIAVDQVALGATYTLTISEKTSIAVGATKYRYPGTDPAAIGFFSLTTASRISSTAAGHGRKATRATVTTPGAVLQGGVPLAPPSYELEAEAGRTFGAVHVGISAGYGRYQDQDGGDRWTGANVTVGSGKSWQMTVSAELGSSDDADHVSVGVSRVQLAVGHRF